MKVKGVLAVALLVACGLAGALFMSQGQAEVRTRVANDDWSHFQLWQVMHSKEYASEWEIQERFGIFRANKHWINWQNQHINFTLGVNLFADLTTKEFKERYLTTIHTSQRREVPTEVKAVADAVDWTTKGAVTDVKNQGQCGSCWSFSSTGSLEGAYFQKNGQLVSFSEQQLVDCSTSYGNQGCNGGLMDQAFQYWEKYGAEKESDYGYTAKDGTCKYDSSKVVTKISGYVDVTKNEVALKQASAERVVSVAVNAVYWQFYFGGVYNFFCSDQLDHGVTLVGYGDTGTKKFWKIKNSWGGSWGENGFIRLVRTEDQSSTGKCGVALSASYPTL